MVGPTPNAIVGPLIGEKKTGWFAAPNRPAAQWNQSHKSTGASFSLDFDAW